MRNVNQLLSIGLFVSLAITGCGKKDGKGTKGPGGGSGIGATAKGQAGAKPTKEAKEDFSKAVARYQKLKGEGKLEGKECEQAADAFLDVFKDHGKPMVAAYFNAGVIYDECGNTEKASKIYKDVIAADPSYDLAYNNLGVIYWKQGKEKQALDQFRKGMNANKLQARANRNNIAGLSRNAYIKTLDLAPFNEAESSIQTVLALDSSNQSAYENLARLYYDRGVLKDPSYLVLANLVVTQALRVLGEEGRKSSEIMNISGLLYMQRDDQINALKAFKSAVEIEPNHAEANLNIAFISIRFRDYETAQKSLNIAFKNKSIAENVEAWLAMGVASRGLKKFDKAEDAYNKAAKLSPKDPRPWYNLAVLNQMHLATADGVDQEGTKKYFNIAKKHYAKFLELAGSNKNFATNALEAKDSLATIDQTFEFFKIQGELEAQAKKMEELQKKQEAEERARLLELEKKAQAAAAAGGGDGGGG